MTKDEISRMAREAGMKIYKGGTVKVGDGVVKTKSVISTGLNELERFAALVAAHEREVCAKLLLDDALALTFQTFGQYRTALAAAIRARNVDSVYTSPERVEKTAESIHDESTNVCQNPTKLVSFGE